MFTAWNDHEIVGLVSTILGIVLTILKFFVNSKGQNNEQNTENTGGWLRFKRGVFIFSAGLIGVGLCFYVFVGSDWKMKKAFERFIKKTLNSILARNGNTYMKPTYTNHDGFFMPKGFPIDGFSSGLKYLAQKDDIFIATYPKCGTTWTLQIVWLITHDGVPFTEKIDDVMPHLEERGREVVEQLKKPRIIKTHLPYEKTPYHPEAKYIYIVRNPFDCVVSFYHHTRGFIQHYNFEHGTFDDFFECFLAGEVDFNDYFANVQSWLKHKNNENIIFLTYEDMKKNTIDHIKKISQFIGYDINNDLLHKILLNSSFQNMSQNQQRWSSKRPDHMPPFIRRGEIGDWKNYFSSGQEQRLREKLDNYPEIKNLWSIDVLGK